ncbi:N-Ribosylnicotinamide phosphorylase [Salmonella enterica subsp. enterica serovar Montevideo str. S5-403]|uniref:N-Ribosylnicotinamide phosphorylase n=1 Tax=Salmonella enterica subsp. enterica serovar Montevideo str. S5-403 TaxID=913242 RepID=G5QAI6_SALMO|nr:N-Ribosylnicotinamide phosphorylase [Salmonella enterica subsp. enterica serovar Montevideo str. S5-403]
MTRAKYALLPGDPGRVDRIARFLDKAEILGQNREFRAARVGQNREFRARGARLVPGG